MILVFFSGKLSLLFKRFVSAPATIDKRTLVGTFEVLPRQFDISFDFKATFWAGSKELTSIIRFTATKKDGAHGLAVLLTKRKFTIFSSASEHIYSNEIILDKWYNIRVTQYFANWFWRFKVYVDGNLLKEWSNSKPEELKNVHVWIGDEVITPQPGFLKNIQVFGKIISSKTIQRQLAPF